MLKEPPSKEKIFQLISGRFKVKSSPPNIRQQTEHLLHEYELDDKTLQKAQLEQHKIFQNFPTRTTPVAPTAAPLTTGAKPKVLSTQGQNDSNNDSSEALFDTKANNTF